MPDNEYNRYMLHVVLCFMKAATNKKCSKQFKNQSEKPCFSNNSCISLFSVCVIRKKRKIWPYEIRIALQCRV